jgi:transcriptional regulator with XRE-family HTH domain
MSILESLIKIRKERNIRQDKVAKYLKVNNTTMSRYENNKRIIPFDKLLLYVEYLGFEIKLMIK